MEYKDRTIISFVGFLIHIYVGNVSTQTSTSVNSKCPWGQTRLTVTEDSLRTGGSNDAFILCDGLVASVSCILLCDPKLSSPVFNCSGDSKVTLPSKIYVAVIHNKKGKWLECKLESREETIIISCKQKFTKPKGISCKETLIAQGVDYPPRVDCLSLDSRCEYTATSKMTSQTPPQTWPFTTSQNQSNTTTSSTTTLSSTSPYKPTAQDNVPTTTPSGAPTDRATLIGGVVGGTLGVIVVVIVVAFLFAWRRNKDRLRKQPKEQPLAFTLPTTEPQTRPIPSPRPDFTKRGHVNISDLSTSNVYEDIDGQNTQAVLTRLQSTHEGEYLELIGPDVSQYAQSTKRNASGKASVNPDDPHTYYQNVEDDVENTAQSEYYVNEEIGKAQQTSDC